MYQEQKKNNVIWSPQKMIALMGERINDERSIYYWAYKNNIPVFCPALIGTFHKMFLILDGAIGDMLFSNSYKNEGFILDTNSDLIKINRMAMMSKKSGSIILGGGLVKHHIMNANIWRNGIDFGIYFLFI
jgi:deoxyhypusine synthase